MHIFLFFFVALKDAAGTKKKKNLLICQQLSEGLASCASAALKFRPVFSVLPRLYLGFVTGVRLSPDFMAIGQRNDQLPLLYPVRLPQWLACLCQPLRQPCWIKECQLAIPLSNGHQVRKSLAPATKLNQALVTAIPVSTRLPLWQTWGLTLDKGMTVGVAWP